MADTTTIHAQATAIAGAAREQVLAAAHLEIERLRTALDAVEADVDDLAAELCETVQNGIVDPTLDRIAHAVRALGQATAGAQLLSTLADVFADHFACVVVGAAAADSLTVWHARGFDPPVHPNTVLRGAPDSAFVRATRTWSPAAAQAPTGILGAPARYAIALPLVARGQGTAMVYAENPPDGGADDRIGSKIALILVETVRPRLHARPATRVADAAAAAAAKQRQARRVKMTDGTKVVVDDSEGTLVDLSTLGAQVVSPAALRPDSAVRLVLPHDNGVAHAARVVWVIAEPSPSRQSAMYRAGVQFTDVQLGDLENYLDFLDFAIKQ